MEIKELLDNKYIISCLVVGLFDTIIVVVTGALFGKDVAATTLAILTALAITFFKKVKVLSFSRRLIDEREVSVNVLKTNYYNVLLVVFSFFGVEFCIILFYCAILKLIKIDFESSSLLGLLDNTFFAISMISINLLSFFITGFIYAKTSTNSNYLGATIGAVIIIILNTFFAIFILFYMSIDISDNRGPFIQILPFIIFWIVYIGLTLLGVYLGFRKRQFVEV